MYVNKGAYQRQAVAILSMVLEFPTHHKDDYKHGFAIP